MKAKLEAMLDRDVADSFDVACVGDGTGIRVMRYYDGDHATLY